jgi:hypothetical protein
MKAMALALAHAQIKLRDAEKDLPLGYNLMLYPLTKMNSSHNC